jgi:hypothetical protein
MRRERQTCKKKTRRFKQETCEALKNKQKKHYIFKKKPVQLTNLYKVRFSQTCKKKTKSFKQDTCEGLKNKQKKHYIFKKEPVQLQKKPDAWKKPVEQNGSTADVWKGNRGRE